MWFSIPAQRGARGELCFITVVYTCVLSHVNFYLDSMDTDQKRRYITYLVDVPCAGCGFSFTGLGFVVYPLAYWHIDCFPTEGKEVSDEGSDDLSGGAGVRDDSDGRGDG